MHGQHGEAHLGMPGRHLVDRLRQIVAQPVACIGNRLEERQRAPQLPSEVHPVPPRLDRERFRAVANQVKGEDQKWDRIVDADGLVEALEIPGHRFALGVQWHAEYDANRNRRSRGD